MTGQSASRRERRRTSPSQSPHARGGTIGTNAPAPISTTCKNKIWLAGTLTTNKCAAFEEQKNPKRAGERRATLPRDTCDARIPDGAKNVPTEDAKRSIVRRRHTLASRRTHLQANPPCTQTLFQTETGFQTGSGCPAQRHSTPAPLPWQ